MFNTLPYVILMDLHYEFSPAFLSIYIFAIPLDYSLVGLSAVATNISDYTMLSGRMTDE